jgi:UDP-GlcNAc:undecaprenyl-phosphate GlcNAc-1-phosphate transferase
MLKGKSPFSPGRDHFHHRLIRGGFGVRKTLGILTGLQAIYATLGLLAHFTGVPDVVMFAAWSILGLSQFRVINIISRHRRAYLLRKRVSAAT